MLAGQIALVTGASRGIGRAIALELARHGATVAGTATTTSGAQAISDYLTAAGAKGAGFTLNVNDPSQCDALVDALQKQYGDITLLINNAGIQHVARVENFPIEKWDAILAINLSSAFHATRLALPAMQKANWGRVINIASVHGLVGSAEKSAYVAAKHGIVGLTKVTALENATSGVTCNAICPGWVLTPLVQKQVDAKAQALGLSNEDATKLLLGEKEPSMQFTTPQELGELAVFFCSAAGNNVRGVAWNMDGAWAAQ